MTVRVWREIAAARCSLSLIAKHPSARPLRFPKVSNLSMGRGSGVTWEADEWSLGLEALQEGVCAAKVEDSSSTSLVLLRPVVNRSDSQPSTSSPPSRALGRNVPSENTFLPYRVIIARGCKNYAHIAGLRPRWPILISSRGSRQRWSLRMAQWRQDLCCFRILSKVVGDPGSQIERAWKWVGSGLEGRSAAGSSSGDGRTSGSWTSVHVLLALNRNLAIRLHH